jgi:putative SOS response-associated peptidase YedK
MDGFAIVTTASDKGMVDIHDRAPVVLPPDVAREWLESGLAPERAEDLARDHAEPTESFEWYEVGKDVGNVKNKGRGLIVAK